VKVEAAMTLGIPVRRLDGWEPVEVHEHEYDGDRLVRTVVRREPEWDDEQRGWAQAWVAYRAGVHDACGHYLPDSTSPAAEDGYEIGEAIRCHACTARGQAYARYKDSPHPEALIFPTPRKG
jgi:hypothetical protein